MELELNYEEELKTLEAKIADAEQNFGDIEVRDAILEKAHLIKNKGNDKELAIRTYEQALKKTIEIGRKMDINFYIISIYLEQRNIGNQSSKSIDVSVISINH